MSITFPKPNLLGPKVPGVIVIGLMVAQYVLFGSASGPEPKCTLSVHNAHISTYLRLHKNIDAIKLNIETKCNTPQKYSEIYARIQEELPGGIQRPTYIFPRVDREPESNTPNRVVVEDLFAQCKKGVLGTYAGQATATIHLVNGKELIVNGQSKEFTTVSCKIGAQ